MRILLPLTLLALLVAALPTPAAAHGVNEAQELETDLINDEGSDMIEPYGGYDINELYIGFAHTDKVGKGEAGDGLYLRIELYGNVGSTMTVPTQSPWSITVKATGPNGTFSHTLSTTDGQGFTGDFDDIITATDATTHEVHVQRAFLSFAHAGLKPGDELKDFIVESRVGNDLRDVAPGGIPAPGTNGAASYPDPTAIPGQGRLVSGVTLRNPTGYVQMRAAEEHLSHDGQAHYNVTVHSLLKKGGQHITLLALEDAGWTYTLSGKTGGPVGPSGNLTFSIDAQVDGPTQPLVLEVRTDVGGRTLVSLQPGGLLTIQDGGGIAPGRDGGSALSPAVGPLLALGLLAAAALARRSKS